MTPSESTVRLSFPVIGKESMGWIESILATGQLTQGTFRRRFETTLAETTGVSHAVTFNSGSSALVAALHALEIGPGDRVVVPDYGFVATANAVELVGATPVFADVDADDFGLSPEALERLGDEPIRAVIVVHQFGLPAKVDAIGRWAEGRGALLLEDAACALGSRTAGRSCGALGIAGSLSFHPRKTVTTGEGGALLTEDREIAERARAFSDHGFVGAEKKVVRPGMNLRLPEISCAIGLAQLQRLDEIVEKRRKIGETYRESLAGIPGVGLPEPPSSVVWNHQTFAVLLEEGIDRQAVIRELRQLGIEVNVPAASLSGLPFYAGKYAVSPARVAFSRVLAERVLGLPCHERLDRETVQAVCRNVDLAVQRRRRG